MDLQTQKLHLIAEVLHLENSELLDKLAAYLHELTQPASPLLDDLPPMPTRSADDLQQRYQQALRELDNGEGIPHEQVKLLMQARFQS